MTSGLVTFVSPFNHLVTVERFTPNCFADYSQATAPPIA